MSRTYLDGLFEKTAFPHRSGTEEELKTARILADECAALGVNAKLESFPVMMAEVNDAAVFADGEPIPAKAVFLSGSGEVEGELCYLPSLDPVSLSGARGKIVLLDTLGIGKFAYHDLVEAGAIGIIFRYGNAYHPFEGIDERDLRPHVVCGERKLLSAMVSAKTAVSLVKKGVKRVRIRVDQREYEGESHNVTAELPGKRNEWIVLSAHYDSVTLSNGAYDNMTGCAGLLGVMDALKGRELNYGLRFVFCGSEERGLLGSKAYVKAHANELSSFVLNVNLDMIGSYMGRFISRVSAEERLAGYISYMGAELGFPVAARTGVYSSDSTPFADSGVPAVSFCRDAGDAVAPIHCVYDTRELVSASQLEKDIAFITEFTRRMAQAAVCPVKREIPENVVKELDEYLFRKRKDGV